MFQFVVLLASIYATYSIKRVEIIKESNIIIISKECQWMTGNIAWMDDKYFLVSYENATGTVDDMIDSSMVAQIYDTKGNKINKESIILADAPPSRTAVFRQQPSQCQCKYNSDTEIENNLMYGWIHESDGYQDANASYKIIYPSNYDAINNPNNLNTSKWIIADNTNINNNDYSAESGICGCLEDGSFVFVWINAFLDRNDSINEYMIFIDQNGNNMNGNGNYIINAMPNTQYIMYLLPCITASDATTDCDTFLGIFVDGIGCLYSISEKGKILKNEFKINQHPDKVEKDDVVDAISLSNGLYAILYANTINSHDINLLFLENNDAIQLQVNNATNWKENVNYNDLEILWIKMKEIKDESNDEMVYLCIIYSDAETSIYGSLYQIKRDNDMVYAQIVDEPFEIYLKPPSNYPIQSINLESIGKTMMVGWTEDNFMFQATIFTLNITEID